VAWQGRLSAKLPQIKFIGASQRRPAWAGFSGRRRTSGITVTVTDDLAKSEGDVVDAIARLSAVDPPTLVTQRARNKQSSFCLPRIVEVIARPLSPCRTWPTHDPANQRPFSLREGSIDTRQRRILTAVHT
jgi:hypothetical protein